MFVSLADLIVWGSAGLDSWSPAFLTLPASSGLSTSKTWDLFLLLC